MNQLSVFLGAEDDMRYIPLRGEMYIGVTHKRRPTLLVLLQPYIDVRVGEMVKLMHAHASKLFGKSRFVLCPVFGRIGVAALHGLQMQSRSVDVYPGTQVYNTTSFLYRAVSIETRDFPTADSRARPSARHTHGCLLQRRR